MPQFYSPTKFSHQLISLMILSGAAPHSAVCPVSATECTLPAGATPSTTPGGGTITSIPFTKNAIEFRDCDITDKMLKFHSSSTPSDENTLRITFDKVSVKKTAPTAHSGILIEPEGTATTPFVSHVEVEIKGGSVFEDQAFIVHATGGSVEHVTVKVSGAGTRLAATEVETAGAVMLQGNSIMSSRISITDGAEVTATATGRAGAAGRAVAAGLACDSTGATCTVQDVTLEAADAIITSTGGESAASLGLAVVASDLHTLQVLNLNISASSSLIEAMSDNHALAPAEARTANAVAGIAFVDHRPTQTQPVTTVTVTQLSVALADVASKAPTFAGSSYHSQASTIAGVAVVSGVENNIETEVKSLSVDVADTVAEVMTSATHTASGSCAGVSVATPTQFTNAPYEVETSVDGMNVRFSGQATMISFVTVPEGIAASASGGVAVGATRGYRGTPSPGSDTSFPTVKIEVVNVNLDIRDTSQASASSTQASAAFGFAASHAPHELQIRQSDVQASGNAKIVAIVQNDDCDNTKPSCHAAAAAAGVSIAGQAHLQSASLISLLDFRLTEASGAQAFVTGEVEDSASVAGGLAVAVGRPLGDSHTVPNVDVIMWNVTVAASDYAMVSSQCTNKAYACVAVASGGAFAAHRLNNLITKHISLSATGNSQRVAESMSGDERLEPATAIACAHGLAASHAADIRATEVKIEWKVRDIYVFSDESARSAAEGTMEDQKKDGTNGFKGQIVAVASGLGIDAAAGEGFLGDQSKYKISLKTDTAQGRRQTAVEGAAAEVRLIALDSAVIEAKAKAVHSDTFATILAHRVSAPIQGNPDSYNIELTDVYMRPLGPSTQVSIEQQDIAAALVQKQCLAGFVTAGDGTACDECKVDHVVNYSAEYAFECAVSACEEGYKPKEDAQSCVCNTTNAVTYDTSVTSQCVVEDCESGYRTSEDRLSCTECEVEHVINYTYLAGKQCIVDLCEPGYKPSADETSCVDCAIDNATNYSSTGICAVAECAEGYKRSADGTACEPCGTGNATFYSRDFECAVAQCKAGTTVSEDKTSCVACGIRDVEEYVDVPFGQRTCIVRQCINGYGVRINSNDVVSCEPCGVTGATKYGSDETFDCEVLECENEYTISRDRKSCLTPEALYALEANNANEKEDKEMSPMFLATAGVAAGAACVLLIAGAVCFAAQRKRLEANNSSDPDSNFKSSGDNSRRNVQFTMQSPPSDTMLDMVAAPEPYQEIKRNDDQDADGEQLDDSSTNYSDSDSDGSNSNVVDNLSRPLIAKPAVGAAVPLPIKEEGKRVEDDKNNKSKKKSGLPNLLSTDEDVTAPTAGTTLNGIDLTDDGENDKDGEEDKELLDVLTVGGKPIKQRPRSDTLFDVV